MDRINGIETVTDNETLNKISFFDWLMLKLMFSDEEKAKKQIRKKAVRSAKES